MQVEGRKSLESLTCIIISVSLAENGIFCEIGYTMNHLKP